MISLTLIFAAGTVYGLLIAGILAASGRDDVAAEYPMAEGVGPIRR